jgi:hypothetical protein
MPRKTTLIKTEFTEKDFDLGTLKFKNLKKTRGSKRRSGGYSYKWEGDVYYPDSNKKMGTLSTVTGGSIKELKSQIRAGLTHIRRI